MMYHIMTYMHEWSLRKRLCKIKLEDSIFLDWFLKYLLLIIAKDIALEHPKTKEEAIILGQQYDLIYS